MWSFRKFSRLNIAVLALLGIIVTGVIGYQTIEGFTLFEAFYMTVITVSTVGFNEVHTLSDNGRLFTAILIISSFGTFAFALSAISSYIFTGEFRSFFRERKVNKTLGRLENHVIICGYGRNGKRAAQEIKAHGVEFVIIEEKEKVIDQIREETDLLSIFGDSTLDEVLEKAGIHSARALISTLPIDADNLLTVLTARQLNKNLLIISRASNDNSYSKLKMAGANNVIMPDKIGGAHMASLVLKPDVIEFFDQIIMQDPNAPYLKEVLCADLSEDKNEHTLAELRRIKKSGVIIIGAKNADGSYIINPKDNLKLSPNSKLFVLGTPEQISGL